MTTIPKKLKVVPTRENDGEYVARIGDNRIGRVRQYPGKKGEKPIFEFTGERPDVPSSFKTRTMRELREVLTRRISRDTYLNILEEKAAA